MVHAKNDFLTHRFGVIFFFYDSCVWTSSNIDSDSDSGSETAIEIEMQGRHIEERVVEGAKGETARQIT
jgi:hypothetical protein